MPPEMPAPDLIQGPSRYRLARGPSNAARPYKIPLQTLQNLHAKPAQFKRAVPTGNGPLEVAEVGRLGAPIQVDFTSGLP